MSASSARVEDRQPGQMKNSVATGGRVNKWVALVRGRANPPPPPPPTRELQQPTTIFQAGQYRVLFVKFSLIVSLQQADCVPGPLLRYQVPGTG